MLSKLVPSLLNEGIGPANLLLLSFNCMSFVSLSTAEGIDPVSLFVPKVEYAGFPNFKVSKFVRSHNVSGIDPTMSFPSMLKYVKPVSFPTSNGIVPVIPLLSQFRFVDEAVKSVKHS